MFDFPASPSSGAVIQNGGVSYRWDGTKWCVGAAGGSGGASITIGDTPPASPPAGSLWWDSISGQLLVWYADPDTSQWVVANSSLGAQVAVGDTPPASPQSGSVWWDSVGGQLYLWYTDPSGSQWVLANSAPIRTDAPNDGRIYARQSQAWTDATTAVAAAPNDTGRNLCLNGMFNIAQRGPGPWTTNGYIIDRWCTSINIDTSSFSQIALTDADRTAIGDEEAQYALQVVVTGSASASANTAIVQRIENLRRFAGRTITLSFWAKASVAGLRLGLNANQSYGTGGSPSAAVQLLATGNTVTLTTGFVRYSTTFTCLTAAGKVFGTNNDSTFNLQVYFSAGSGVPQSGNLPAQSGTVQLWGVQVEYGSVMTPLAKRDVQQEYHSCLRHYQNIGQLVWNTQSGGSFHGWSWVLPVVMRTAPTIVWTDNASNASRIWCNTNVGVVNNISFASGSFISGAFILALDANMNMTGSAAFTSATWARANVTLSAEQ